MPIALALIIPGLSFYANFETLVPESLGILKSWFFASIIIYLLWYVLWYTWEINTRFRTIWFFINISIFVGVVIGFVFIVGPNKLDNFQPYYVFRVLFGSILFLTIQYTLRTQQNISKLQLEKEQIETDKYKAQLKTLQAQVDPHFLFNSLNTLRSMVRQHHDNSEQFIMSLSDFYRKTLKHNEDTTLPLSKELDVLKSYLFLMKSRNEEAVRVSFDIDPELNKLHLPTLALQVVVENCFKHNSMTSKRPLLIDITSTEDHFIVVSNNIQPKIEDSRASGYGLDMLEKRYKLLNIQNGVVLNKDSKQFTVKLKLI